MSDEEVDKDLEKGRGPDGYWVSAGVERWAVVNDLVRAFLGLAGAV
jgi:hypothetical protein